MSLTDFLATAVLTSQDEYNCGFPNLFTNEKDHAKLLLVPVSSSMEGSTDVDSMRASDGQAAAATASSAQSNRVAGSFYALQSLPRPCGVISTMASSDQILSNAEFWDAGCHMNILSVNSPSSSSSTSSGNELFRDHVDHTTSNAHETEPDLCSLMSNLDARPHISSMRKLRKDRLSRVKQLAERGLSLQLPTRKSTKCESLFSLNSGSRQLQKFRNYNSPHR